MDIASQNKLIKTASYFAVTATAIIIIAKVSAWIITDSMSIYASLIDSLLDIAASLINMFAIHYALQPPDNEHRFGHGKAEDLAVLFQASLFGVSGVIVTISVIRKLFAPQEISNKIEGIYIMLFSILVTIILITYQKFVIKKTNSTIIKADNFHYVTDLLTNSATVIVLTLEKYSGYQIIDPLFALVIASYILYGSWKLLKQSFDNLMDKELDDDQRAKIIDIIISNKQVKGFHDLKTRYAGNRIFIQFHIEIDGNLSLNEAHHITENVEKNIFLALPNAEIIIHQDPIYDKIS